MGSSQVFTDPSGRRWKRLKRGGIAAALVVSVAATLFGTSFLIIPFLPKIPGLSGPAVHPPHPEAPALPPRQDRLARYLLRKSRMALWREMTFHGPTAAKPAPPPAGAGSVVAAFYVPWQETGLHSLRAHAKDLTHLMPEWLHVDRTGSRILTNDWNPELTPHNLDVVQIARAAGVRICPILNNAEQGLFDPKRIQLLVRSPANQRSLSEQVRDFLLANKFQGVNLDFENLSDEEYRQVVPLVGVMASTLHAAGLSVSMDVEAGRPEIPLRALSRHCDFLVLMAYDQHFEGGDPGPIAAAGWFHEVLKRTLEQVPPDKLVVGMGGYAYDWGEGKKAAEVLTYQSALLLAEDNHPGEPPEKVIDFDADALNATFGYQDDDGKYHEVWMLDAASLYDEWLVARRRQVLGAALWVLGNEDPGVWPVLSRGRLMEPPPPSRLQAIDFPYEVDFEGEGELLSVQAEPSSGRRRLEVDRDTGLITDEDYVRFPSSYIIRREGYLPKTVVLSFDDGPDPTWTPKILDELKAQGVPGTFFVIGEHAERYPGLVRREYQQGYEIGSHTFSHPNLAAVSHRRAVLELNTTQRALQAITGHSTILFRAPYNADAEPVSAEEVHPIQLASELGYVTVGELIDAQDWNLYAQDAEGRPVRRTPEEIEEEIFRQLGYKKGNVILLHDGGGDRSMTLEVLRRLIPELKRRGYRFASVSDLIGLPRNKVMPPVESRDLALLGLDRVMFEGIYLFELFLHAAFLAAIALGIGRVVVLVPMALAARARARRKRWGSEFRPSLSALVAAYNERPVIARTVQSLLENRYQVDEVVVVDDGSTDGTAEAVQEHFGSDARVRLIRQANAGKAAALNRAAGEAKGEILLCLDADTQLDPEAVGRLVRHFEDPRVAAVAGNVKVGNRVNLLTLWQSIEYVTSQNMDRRAYGLLNAVTVVPGAVGAWRREDVLAAGGYRSDSMAEDMDLTWRLRRMGRRVATEEAALGFTEAPQTLRAFFRQRFRWTYGTLQCLWKHKGALLRYGWFGRFALPALWLFQVGFQVLAPLVDLQILYSFALFLRLWLLRGVMTRDWQPLPQATHALSQALFFYGLFFAVDLAGAALAYLLDKEKLRSLWWLFFQRFFYRQVLYAALWKSLWVALKGVTAGWGKLERRGTVAPVTK
jgi:cellulose synthase/poly-beta-1,6-N-acetylglucosamine synthase-like glycosyltransferase/peptidoglycan/xylan/chitin deacetylase (PgdA/CDA1 family)/spore germination protein YaaH